VALAQPKATDKAAAGKPLLKPKDLAGLKAELTKQHGEGSRVRVERGVDQMATLWTRQDGSEAEFKAFARENFVADQKELDKLFARFQANFEQIDGHLLEIGRELRRPSDLDVGPLLKVDPLFAAYDPGAHLYEDFFKNKVAFVVLLNFPLATLKEKLEQGKNFSRRTWAEVRLAGRFGRRVPAEVQLEVAAAAAAAEL
jgi:hypothetical protein